MANDAAPAVVQCETSINAEKPCENEALISTVCGSDTAPSVTIRSTTAVEKPCESDTVAAASDAKCAGTIYSSAETDRNCDATPSATTRGATSVDVAKNGSDTVAPSANICTCTTVKVLRVGQPIEAGVGDVVATSVRKAKSKTTRSVTAEKELTSVPVTSTIVSTTRSSASRKASENTLAPSTRDRKKRLLVEQPTSECKTSLMPNNALSPTNRDAPSRTVIDKSDITSIVLRSTLTPFISEYTSSKTRKTSPKCQPDTLTPSIRLEHDISPSKRVAHDISPSKNLSKDLSPSKLRDNDKPSKRLGVRRRGTSVKQNKNEAVESATFLREREILFSPKMCHEHESTPPALPQDSDTLAPSLIRDCDSKALSALLQ